MFKGQVLHKFGLLCP